MSIKVKYLLHLISLRLFNLLKMRYEKIDHKFYFDTIAFNKHQ
jgi:hypothetical protein